MKIFVINGPNINMLGVREPQLYGSGDYGSLIELIKQHAKNSGVEVVFFQSNHEGAIIDAIQSAYYDNTDGIIINPAAYTHTSIAIADAIKAVKIPAVEVHLTDISAREEYRRQSYVRECAVKTVMGKGFSGYIEAFDFLVKYKGESK